MVGIVVDDIVLDCTSYKKKHPGGKAIMEGFGGQNCTWQVCGKGEDYLFGFS